MIIIIVLILAVISGIFMYNKFQQQELKQLTEEANKLLQQDLINDEIDNEIKTNKNYAIVEKTIKEYLTNIKNTYLEIEQLNSALDADKVFSASNVEDKAFKNVDNLIEEDKQKGKENLEKCKDMIKEENIIEAINAQKFSSNKEYYIEIYKTIMLSDLMKNQYEKIEQKVEKSKDKLYDNLTIISNTKKYLESLWRCKHMELKDRIKNYYKSEKVKVDDEFVSGVIADKDRANKLIKFFEPIEVKAMNYIYGKDENNKYFTEYELESVSKVNLFDKNVVNLCKIIWDNRNDTERLEKFIKQLKSKQKLLFNENQA